MSFRLTAEQRDQAERLAKRQDKSLSQFARQALEERIADSLLAEAIRRARLQEQMRRRGPGVLDLAIDAYIVDVDDGEDVEHDEAR